MKAERYLPVDALKPYIRAFLIIETDEGMLNRLLPDTALVAAFRLCGEVKAAGQKLPAAVISGLRRSVREVQYARQSSTLLVLFREGGASAFFRLPLHELFDASVSLREVFDRQEVSDLEEQLAETSSDLQRIAVAERFFLSKLRRMRPDPVVEAAIRHMHGSGGIISIASLAETLCLSQDAFEKRFRSHTGASPKRFAATVRFRKLVERYTPEISFTELAYLGGYFDQSHFIRDFRAFTGQSPHVFFTSSRYW